MMDVSRESRERLESFVSLLLAWQNSHNLIAPSTIQDVWQRHVEDSLQLLALLPERLEAFADLGSGGGFPALPVAIASGAVVHLYESNQKKAAFLREALRTTNTRGVVHCKRLPPIGPTPDVKLITARALAPLGELLMLAKPFLDQGAKALLMKGEKVEAELTEAEKSWRIRYTRHPSSTDSRAVILEIHEAHHVR